ncbi:PqiC family protein, partial [Bordetella holmesii]
MKPLRLSASLILLSLLAACGSSPPARYYTLQTPAPSATASAGNAGFMIEVLPVIVPAQADQPQIMLRTGEGSIVPLYSERWSAPLGDELRAALSDGLTRDLGVLDVRVVRPPVGTPVWRVQADVQRFDVSERGQAVLDVTWRARPISVKGQALICRSIIALTAPGTDIPHLVVAQQQAAA